MHCTNERERSDFEVGQGTKWTIVRKRRESDKKRQKRKSWGGKGSKDIFPWRFHRTRSTLLLECLRLQQLPVVNAASRQRLLRLWLKYEQAISLPSPFFSFLSRLLLSVSSDDNKMNFNRIYFTISADRFHSVQLHNYVRNLFVNWNIIKMSREIFIFFFTIFNRFNSELKRQLEQFYDNRIDIILW